MQTIEEVTEISNDEFQACSTFSEHDEENIPKYEDSNEELFFNASFEEIIYFKQLLASIEGEPELLKEAYNEVIWRELIASFISFRNAEMENGSKVATALQNINIEKIDKFELLDIFQKLKEEIRLDDEKFFSVLNKIENI